MLLMFLRDCLLCVFSRRDNKLDDSQGFCCECELGDFLGAGEAAQSRAGMLCDALDTGSAHATAHCMRLKDLWYDAYNVEAAEAHFNIDIRFRQCEDDACTQYEDTVLTIGPGNPEARDPVTGSSARFIGEVSTPTSRIDGPRNSNSL